MSLAEAKIASRGKKKEVRRRFFSRLARADESREIRSRAEVSILSRESKLSSPGALGRRVMPAHVLSTFVNRNPPWHIFFFSLLKYYGCGRRTAVFRATSCAVREILTSWTKTAHEPQKMNARSLRWLAVLVARTVTSASAPLLLLLVCAIWNCKDCKEWSDYVSHITQTGA